MSVTAGVACTVPALFVAWPLMVRVAAREPVAEGVKDMTTVQLLLLSTSREPVVVEAVQVPPLTT